ncbi:MAG: SIR2 family protein [Acidimicrobiales bacterium]
MAGHLFVTRGDLLALTCDAILVPCGGGPTHSPGYLVRPWNRMNLPLRDGHLVDPPDGDRRVVLVRDGSDTEPAVWAGHTGEGRKPPWWYAEAARLYLRQSAEHHSRLTTRPIGDHRPLVAMPFVGAGAGGMSHRKGEVVKAIVHALLDELQSVDADIVLVLADDASYSAAQEARRRYMPDWPELDELQMRRADELASKARAGRLVLFLGAGVSMGAGLPSWRQMLLDLGSLAGLTEAEISELDTLDPRDAGAVLSGRIGEKRLRWAIEESVGSEHLSLMHQILASLPVAEAMTTNYDTMFERAWRDTGRKPSVLPQDGTATGEHWLLKLHGSLDDHKRPLVLSRSDYLRFEDSSQALAGLVHAMLLTRHLLFVGYSLSDDNFHRIVHQVQATLSESRAAGDDTTPFGTVLTSERPRLVHEVWHGDIQFLSTVGGASSTPVRRLAILLDYLAAATSARAEHLMDPTFDAVFTADERALRDKLDEVMAASRANGVRLGIREAVDEALSRFRGSPGP